MRSLARSWLAFVLIGLLGLCPFAARAGSGNPLIGTWHLDEEASGIAGAAFAFGGGTMEFRADKMLSGSNVLAVEYEVEDDRVIVMFPSQGRGQVYQIMDRNRIALEVIPGQQAVFQRAGTEVEPGVAATPTKPASHVRFVEFCTDHRMGASDGCSCLAESILHQVDRREFDLFVDSLELAEEFEAAQEEPTLEERRKRLSGTLGLPENEAVAVVVRVSKTVEPAMADCRSQGYELDDPVSGGGTP